MSFALSLLACLFTSSAAIADENGAPSDALKEAEEFERGGDIVSAMAKYKDALKSDPKNDAIRAGILNLYCKLAKDRKPGQVSDADLQLELGDALQFEGDYDGASEHYQKAIVLSKDKVNPEADRRLAALAEISSARTIIHVSPPRKIETAENETRSKSSPEKPLLLPDFAAYMNSVERKIQRNWHPPHGSGINDKQKVVVIFTVDQDGKLCDLKISFSSKNIALDEAALQAVRAAAPFAPLPKNSKKKVDIQFTFDYNPISQYRTVDDVPDPRFAHLSVEHPDFSTKSSVRFVGLYAEGYMRIGEFAKAADLYQILLNFMQGSNRFEPSDRAFAKSCFACATLFKTANGSNDPKLIISLVPACLKKLDRSSPYGEVTRKCLEKSLLKDVLRNNASILSITEDIVSRTDLSDQTKLSFLKLMVDAQETNSASFERIADAKSLSKNLEMKIENVDLADKESDEAFKLEKKSSFDQALKLYKNVLAAKQRNLGVNSEQALLVYGDIARVLFEQKKFVESQALYENAIEGLEKIRSTSSQYVELLENFGAMLNEIGKPSLANKAYAEAKRVTKTKNAE